MQVSDPHPTLFLLKCETHSLICVFERRQRDHKPQGPEYEARFDTLKVEKGHLSAVCTNTKNSIEFSLDLYLLRDSRFRFRFNELNPIKPRFEVKDVIIDSLEQEK